MKPGWIGAWNGDRDLADRIAEDIRADRRDEDRAQDERERYAIRESTLRAVFGSQEQT